ncbi:MAG: FxLYD domain-containing protein [Melioribacteraceae bacterium]|nr:FxLYD domain-containing protein [Melioribacteraceae bacterium]
MDLRSFSEFDDYSIKVKGIVVNNLGRTVRNVKVIGTVSDKYDNNTKQSFDYIDVIYAGKKSRFEISVYYGSRTPSSIRYSASIADYDY